MRRWRALLAAAGATCLACATPIVEPEELPEAPIAFLYRTLEQGRERADLLAESAGEKAPSPEGLMRLNEIDELIGKMRGEPRQMKPELQGRLSLLHPRTLAVEPLRAFVVGAVPTDWSADRERLMVVSRHRGSAQLYEYNRERGDVARLLRGHDDRLDGCYGPDGRVAFVHVDRSQGGIRMRIAVTESDGSATLLSDGPADTRVRWSPDGRWILYQSALRNGRAVIKALDLADPDAEPRVVARGVEHAISPLGDWVVYARERGDGHDLWRMRPDGSGKTALGARSQGDADERNPTISPDGRFVAYVAEEGHRQRIRIRRMDGTGDRLFLEDADGTLPVW